MVHQYNSTTYGSVYRCTTVVLPNPLLVNRAPELTDFALQIALPHFMRIFLGRVRADRYESVGQEKVQNALGSAADWLFPPRASCSAQARAPR